MSYTITKTDGTALSTANMPGGSLLDGTTDSSTGVTLIGRNFPNYGDAQNENFVRLLENFADNVPPTQSLSALNILVGSIWYDTNIKKIRVYDGTNWNPASSTIVANLAPTSATYTIGVGDQWWDTVNNQLNAWTGNVWMLVGPDRAGFARVETELQSNVALINANVTQLRIDTGNYMTANVATLNSTIGQLRVDTGNYMTANVIAINSTIGQLRIDTGNYMTANVVTLNSTIGQLRVDTGNYMTANVAAINATILSVQNGINANVNSLSISTTNSLNTLTSNATTQQTSINSINATLLTLAPLASPALTGTPTAPTALANNNTTQIATTAYVDASALVLSTDYNSKISNEVTARNSAIATATSTLANISSPTFTGTPTAPTATSGDNSTKLATTAFVTQAVAASGMHYTVSSSAPSGGNNGDFWFQV